MGIMSRGLLLVALIATLQAEILYKQTIHENYGQIEAVDNDFTGEVVGYAEFRINPEDSSAYIALLRVFQGYQKKGIGAELLTKALYYIRTRGCKQITLIASPYTKEISIKKLVEFYRRFGFEVFPEEKKRELDRGIESFSSCHMIAKND
ncbi:MAG: GNAT family N-acetyltransferase [Candidatus Dependentiae bacterium]|nr:GNAT family N-acetyltransferase [Candidatus Dependentiae bacterium]